MRKIPAVSYKAFVHAFLVFYFVFPCSLASFNYTVDPGHRYRFSVPDEDLTRLFQTPDSLLDLPANHDDRALLKKAVRLAGKKEILLLGGSRILNIRADMFKKPQGEGLFNAGVTAGTIRDYVALWQMVKQAGWRPKTVFIGIEEQSLNTRSENDLFRPIQEYYEAFFQRGLSFRVRFMGWTTDLKDLLSLKTTLASVRVLAASGPREAWRPRAEGYDMKRTPRTAAFARIYPSSEENRGVDVVRAEGNENGQGSSKALARWNRNERKGLDQLALLIEDIKKNGGTPILVGMPYHPEAYRLITQEDRAQANLTFFVEELRKIASSKGIFFYDAILEHRTDYAPEDFMDGVHLKTRANHSLFRRVDRAFNLQLVD